MSKVLLMERIIHENPFHTNDFAWIDASLSRIQMNINNYTFDKLKINTNPNEQYYMGKHMYSSAGYMISSRDIWLVFIDLYKQKLEVLKDSNYAHDEETVIFSIYNDTPALFRHVLHKSRQPFLSGKCMEPSCIFLKHENPSNNGGTHCCLGCMKNNGRHGPLCTKIVYTQ
jgi:hypothetical protein